MGLLLEILLFLGIFLPMYHMVNALPFRKKKESLAIVNYGVTIIIPSYNEELIVAQTIRGLLAQKYDNKEIIFVNDGSKDKTWRILSNVLDLTICDVDAHHALHTGKINGYYKSKKYKRFYAIDLENSGKGYAINAGINYASNELIVTLDADSILEEEALNQIIPHFYEEDVVAASGIIQILQSYDFNKKNRVTLNMKTLLKLQTIEYIKSCYTYKSSLAKHNALIVISGAYGIFRKKVLVEIGGFKSVVGEDLEITLNIHFDYLSKNNGRIIYEPRSICYTEGPETLADLLRQRLRWQKSFIEGLIHYKYQIKDKIFKEPLSFFMVIDALLIGVFGSVIIFLLFILAIFFRYGISDNFINYLLIYFGVHLLYSISSLLIAKHFCVIFRLSDLIRLIYTVIVDLTIYRVFILFSIVGGTLAYYFQPHTWDRVQRSGRDYDGEGGSVYEQEND